ncbi:DNA mismatch repair protein MutS [Aquimarina sp. D1M17]|uniref:DNA mismatch repair protein MutS n=1 Tax=Aquimarina acroporae TaxID=2937283 RepID=UPI0020BDF04B|nr:DNA mismatch repair protein MutS [Aquimarina acroporae]MCK8524099.1 DNA mismatch repair protein MutS [Aquimarina acroporae]
MMRKNKGVFEIGDIVSVIDDPITGSIVAIDDGEVVLETEDGFEMTFLVSEVVRVQSGEMILPSYEEVHKNLQHKEVYKKKPKRPVSKPKERNAPPMEVDLHIHKLIKSTKGMTNHDMVTLQLDTAKRQLDFAISKRIPKVVFIHGVGQGVLKEELKYLFGRYDNVRISDADYKKYGLGAMELYIIQNPK